MGLRDAKFSVLLVCRDLVRLLVIISIIYLIGKGSALLFTTKFIVRCKHESAMTRALNGSATLRGITLITP